MTVLKMHIVNVNVTKMYVNCGSRNVCCSVYEVEIISLALKRLIVLRSAIKTHDQTHRVLRNVYHVLKCEKYTYMYLVHRLVTCQ